MYEVSIKTEFASAHNLRNYEGACEAIHGHNWKVEVTVAAKNLDNAGLAIDFKLLKERTDKIIDELDHVYLNDLEVFKAKNPSSENIARYIYDELKQGFQDEETTLRRVTVWETDDASATYME